VAATPDGGLATPAETVRLQFQLSNLPSAVKELETRGVTFELIQNDAPGTAPYASFHTPHGVLVELFGEVTIVMDEELPEDQIDDDDGDDDETPLDSFWAEDEWEETESEDRLDEAIADEPEAVGTLVIPAAKKEPSMPVIEITYEDISDKEDSGYEDEDEPLPVKREPVPSLAARGREPRSTQRAGLPSTEFRQLDIPLEPGALVRNRRKRHDGAVIFPLRDDRDQRRSD